MSRPLPLSRYTVLDLTLARAGPTAVRLLSDWGANIIRIEPPLNLDASSSGLTKDRYTPDAQNLHRNKRSITINLKTSQGNALFMRLASQADVIVENFRSEVKHRLGIDYETIRAFNPRIVYASISGFGQDGPLSKRPGFDQIAQGMGGLMSITGAPGQGPMRVGIPIADLTAGGFAAQGVLLALLGREKTGEGQWVQTSLLQAQIAMLDFQATRWLMDSEVPPQAGNNHPTSIPTGVFETSDGFINIAAVGQHIWKRFKEEVGDSRLDDEMFETRDSRSENRDLLGDLINDNMKKDSSKNWIKRLNAAGVPSGEINTIDKVFSNEQVRHLGIARDMNSIERGAVQVVGQPIIMSNVDPSIQRPPPGKGEHSREILAEFGYSDAEIDAFANEGVI